MPPSQSVRIFLVDDHPIVRMGFRALLEQSNSFSIAGEAGSGEEALEMIPDRSVDLALVDISMEGMGGIELTRQLKRDYPEVRVLVVSMHDENHFIRQALDAGANGYILKDNVDEEIDKAARAVLGGRQYLCTEVKKRL